MRSIKPQDRIQDLGLEAWGAKSSAEDASIEAPQAPESIWVGYGEGVPLPYPLKVGSGARKFILWSRNAYFGAFSGPSVCLLLLLHCNTSMQVQISSTPAHSDIPG